MSAPPAGSARVLPAGPARFPTVSVVIAAYDTERWDHLRGAVASVAAQTVPVLETIVIIDHNPDLLSRARGGLAGVTVIPNISGRGASGARNTGVAASRGEVVAFLDDDAAGSPAWLENLLRHFADPRVVGVGGRLTPLWHSSRPRWFPPEFDWVVGASYRGMPEKPEAVRNVWSASMAIRREVFDALGGFRDNFGKVGRRPRPEDTDLCLRAVSTRTSGTWIYEPAGIAIHRVPPERATFRYFFYRCFSEGLGKSALADLDGAADSTRTEWRYTRSVLFHGFAGGLRETVLGDATGGARSLAIAAGLSVTVAGFLAGRLTSTIRAGATRAASGARGRAVTVISGTGS